MKDKRIITIKNHRLQKIRNGLRDVLIKSIVSKLTELLDKRQDLKSNPDGSRQTIDDLPPDKLKQFRTLQEQESELSFSLDRSILVCVSCGKGHRDMVYNKAYDAWYCTECYGMERAYAKKLRQKRATSESHEDKAIKNHSKTFL